MTTTPDPTSCLQKQAAVKKLFAEVTSKEAIYEKIIALGRQLPKIDSTNKSPENIVKGCQSIVYLVTEKRDGRLFFEAESEALISAGLAALLVMAYSGESPEVILTCPPDFLADLGINNSLTPNRANGLYSMHLRMRQEAIKALTT
jgi:cysteine desulfuration protein SufE